MDTMFLLIVLVVLSFILTWIIRRFANKLNIVDIPNNRSSHEKPTPRGGGLAIVLTWYSAITVLFFYNQIESNLYYAFLFGIILAAISIIDDIFSLKPLIRLIAQFITAMGAVYFLDGLSLIIGNIEINQAVVIPALIIGIIWFINLYNFLDGIDGYASVEAISVALGLYIFTGNLILLLLIASVLGFLIWNWPKAKIFMGDVGSTQLGFILAVIGIHFHNKQDFSIFYWILLTAPFWFDASYTLFRRWKNKEKLSQAHRKHAYQRIVQAGFSHLKTDFYLIVINIIIIGILFIIITFSNLLIPAFLMVILFLFALTRRIDKLKSF